MSNVQDVEAEEDESKAEKPDDEPQAKQPKDNTPEGDAIQEMKDYPLRPKRKRRSPTPFSTEDETTDDEQPKHRPSGIYPIKSKLRKSSNARKKPRLSKYLERAPDLPAFPTVPKNLKRSKPQIQIRTQEDRGESIEVGIKANLHRALPGSPPLEYEFKALKGVVSSLPPICFPQSSHLFNRRILNTTSLEG
jgi:hypothetical protein